jgi:hypothetical protein
MEHGVGEQDPEHGATANLGATGEAAIAAEAQASAMATTAAKNFMFEWV